MVCQLLTIFLSEVILFYAIIESCIDFQLFFFSIVDQLFLSVIHPVPCVIIVVNKNIDK